MAQSPKMSIQDAISLAKKSIKQGQPARAAELYANVLQQEPNHPVAKKGLRKLKEFQPPGQPGIGDSQGPSAAELQMLQRLQDSGQLQATEQACRELLRRYPNAVIVLILLGAVLGGQKRPQEAVQVLNKALGLNPNALDAYIHRAMALQAMGMPAQAVDDYDRAVRLRPDSEVSWFNRGNALNRLGRFDEAVRSFDKAIRINPDRPASYNNRGNALRSLRRFDEAVACFDQAIELQADYYEVHNNRGNALKEQGKLEEAITSYDRAIQISPGSCHAYLNKAMALAEVDRHEEALACCDEAIRLEPGFPEAHVNRGALLQARTRLAEAAASYQKALDLNPGHLPARCNLANAKQELGQLDEAIDGYAGVLEIAAQNQPAISNFLLALNYSPDRTPQEIFRAHIRHGKEYTASVALAQALDHSRRPGNERLKIGYVSPDFRDHSVAYFFEPLLQHHDRDNFEVYCYYNNIKRDGTTERLEQQAEHWRPIATMRDEDVVATIVEDNIDILVDLAGHTHGNRLTVFVARPAPVQATWLGYPNTTGLDSMDYRLTDEIADPIGNADEFCSEKLLRLPAGFLCFQGDDAVPSSMELPAIRNGYVTFGSFNNFTKVTPEVIAAWARILRRSPDSRFVIKARQLADSAVQARCLEMFRHEGVPADRIDVVPPINDKTDHLRLYDSVDIALDSFPYNGTTTTCEALWMGVPVITLCGDRHSGRVGASILSHVGLDDLVAGDVDSYVTVAADLGRNTGRLAQMRSGLREQMKNSQLCDARRFACSVEAAYKEIWENRQR